MDNKAGFGWVYKQKNKDSKLLESLAGTFDKDGMMTEEERKISADLFYEYTRKISTLNDFLSKEYALFQNKV